MNDIEAIEYRYKELQQDDYLYLNGYNVQRIVYELIKNYMVANPPDTCGINLAQRYDLDITKSSIFLDVSYNWKAQAIDKVPAIYVQRGNIDIKSPTLTQSIHVSPLESEDTRITINTMPVIVTCVAASPVAVVENLAEYVKQPLLSFRREIKQDFRLRGFFLTQISSPTLLPESKTNFAVNLTVNTVFDESWMIKRDDLKIKSCQVIFDVLTGLHQHHHHHGHHEHHCSPCI